jgi:hypothetical protein
MPFDVNPQAYRRQFSVRPYLVPSRQRPRGRRESFLAAPWTVPRDQRTLKYEPRHAAALALVGWYLMTPSKKARVGFTMRAYGQACLRRSQRADESISNLESTGSSRENLAAGAHPKRPRYSTHHCPARLLWDRQHTPELRVRFVGSSSHTGTRTPPPSCDPRLRAPDVR